MLSREHRVMSTPHEQPLCPRCGYDQSGIVTSWRDSCPTEGRCAECGLEFAWTELFRPDLHAPDWSFEHANKHLFRCLMQTFVRSLWPMSFWKSLRLTHPIHTRRLIKLAVGILVTIHLLLAAGGYAWFFVLSNIVYKAGSWRYELLSFSIFVPDEAVTRFWITAAIMPYYPRLAGDEVPTGSTELLMAFCWSFLIPLGFLALRQTLRHHSVRSVHILRAWAYSLPGLAMWIVLGRIPKLIGIEMTAIGTAAHAWWWTQYEFICFLVLSAWLLFYWTRVSSRYLRLKRPVVTTLVLYVVTLMIAGVSLMLFI